MRHGLPQVEGKRLGVFVEEHVTGLLGFRTVVRLGTLHYDGSVGTFAVKVLCERHSGIGVFLSVARESGIGHESHYVVSVAVYQRGRLFIVAGHEHLAAAAHTEHRLMLIKRLGREHHRLLEQKFEEVWQYRAVEPD